MIRQNIFIVQATDLPNEQRNVNLAIF